MKISLKKIILVITGFLLLSVCMYYCYPNFFNGPFYIFVKDLITFALSIAGLCIAGGGLYTWRSQIEYTKGHEVAENLHHSLLKLRDAIKHVRNPAIFPSESYEAAQRFKSKYPDVTEKEINERNEAYVYELRWEEIRNVSTELDSNLLMAEVHWGREIRKLMVPLKEKISELNISLKQNFKPDFRTKKPMEIRSVIYDSGDWTSDKEDAFGESVSGDITAVMDYINSKIS